MPTLITTCEHGKIGRNSARLALRIPKEFEETINTMSIQNGWRFSAWAMLYLGLWGAGVLALLLLRSHTLLQLLVSIFLGNQLHAITILQHDCGHRSAFQSPVANLWVGRVLAWFVFMPFTTFTELHRCHHGFLGQADQDPDEWFYGAGCAQLFLRECCFMPRFIYLSLTRPLGTEVRRNVILELTFNVSTYAALVLSLLLHNASDILLFGFLLPMSLLACVFNPISRGYEHCPMAYLPAGDARREDLRFNTITVSSRLVGLLWANINYHVEHHMYPRVPFHQLPALHALFGDKFYLRAPYPLFNLKTLRAQPAHQHGYFHRS